MVRVWATLESEREKIQGEARCRVIRMRALRRVLTILDHGVGQRRDTGDETRVQFGFFEI